MMAKAKIWGSWFPESEKANVAIFCPGCKTHHVIATKVPQSNGALWAFNGSMEAPTFTPSLLVRTGKYVPGHEAFDDEGYNLSSICHSFIREGKIQFLGDCTHALKNQTVDLPEVDQ
jgi:hypothetical protein